MKTNALAKLDGSMPTLFGDFFKPWNEWLENDNLWNKSMNVPAVNITEEEKQYLVELAAPGMRKKDFNIDIEGNMLTISSRQEQKSEETNKKFTRKEYSYSSFSRSFTLPDEINKLKIEAKYEDGVLKIILPRMENAKKTSVAKVAVK
ncbi:MAG: Hsp20/alpha crystallin family protein [Bacteroidota bacterium]